MAGMGVVRALPRKDKRLPSPKESLSSGVPASDWVDSGGCCTKNSWRLQDAIDWITVVPSAAGRTDQAKMWRRTPDGYS